MISAGIFKETFKSLGHVQPAVLYPIPDFDALNKAVDKEFVEKLPQKPFLFLSINRYERKKNISLAVMAFGKLMKLLLNIFFSKVFEMLSIKQIHNNCKMNSNFQNYWWKNMGLPRFTS